MLSVEKCTLPQNALLARYVRSGVYTDCYCTETRREVSQEQFVDAFYTTWLFKLERIILQLAVSKPSTDNQARQLAAGEVDAFAAWRVEDRDENQLLLSDINDRTRSWLMVVAPTDHDKTRLYFGSAITPKPDAGSGKESLGPVFSALVGFHKVYSVLLLRSARLRLERSLI